MDSNANIHNSLSWKNVYATKMPSDYCKVRDGRRPAGALAYSWITRLEFRRTVSILAFGNVPYDISKCFNHDVHDSNHYLFTKCLSPKGDHQGISLRRFCWLFLPLNHIFKGDQTPSGRRIAFNLYHGSTTRPFFTDESMFERLNPSLRLSNCTGLSSHHTRH